MGLDQTTFTMYPESNFPIEFYADARSRSQPWEYLRAMKPAHRAKAERLLSMLAERGPQLRRPYADVLEGRIRELRPIIEGHQHRLLFVVHGRRVLVTNAFLKKTDAVPLPEIERAERSYADWLRYQEE